MITVLLLAGVEKLVNFAIRSDKITQAGLAPLSGKLLRLNLKSPLFSLDVLFNDDHIRFEPVSRTQSVFEPQGSAPFSQEQNKAASSIDQPDCTLNVANIAELLNLMRAPEGNLPIEGDYKVLMQLKQLLAGFDPDIAGQLEPLIGVPLASQLGLLINQLKGSVSSTAKHTFNDVADWANDVTGNAPVDPQMQAETDDLKQQLLKLRADVEREQARLEAIKQQQAIVQSHNDA